MKKCGENDCKVEGRDLVADNGYAEWLHDEKEHNMENHASSLSFVIYIQ